MSYRSCALKAAALPPPSSPPHPISIKPNIPSPKIDLFDMEIMRICEVWFHYQKSANLLSNNTKLGILCY